MICVGSQFNHNNSSFSCVFLPHHGALNWCYQEISDVYWKDYVTTENEMKTLGLVLLIVKQFFLYTCLA